jgi:hypothetical protein
MLASTCARSMRPRAHQRAIGRPCAATMTAKRALVPIANGTEEMEAVIMIDVLRRAGIDVCVASVEGSLIVTASRGVKIGADASIEDCVGPFDLIALPVRAVHQTELVTAMTGTVHVITYVCTDCMVATPMKLQRCIHATGVQVSPKLSVRDLCG